MNLVDAETAVKVAERGFPDGGYRLCRCCNKFQKVAMEMIAKWIKDGTSNCLICGGRTELMSTQERERMVSGK